MKHLTTYPLEEKEIILSGQYWVGDPCYVFPNKEWDKLCKLMYPNFNEPDFDDSNTIRVVNVDGLDCYIFGTAHGDGSYELLKSNKRVGLLGVDAGMLSMIPIELVNMSRWGESEDSGVIIELKSKKKRLIGVDNGDFFFGKYSINTSGDNDEYEDEDEDDYDSI